MAEEKKYPKVAVGAFIFNEKGELFLMKTRQWKDRYACPGGKVEIGETLAQAVKREVKEETNLDIYDVKFFSLIDGLDIGGEYLNNEKHFVFVDYTAKTGNHRDVKLGSEGSGYKWLKLEDWLRIDRSEFPHRYVIDELKKLKDGPPKDWEDKCKRALADYQNLLKQTAKEKAEFVKYANASLLYELLPVYDNLKLSLKHLDKEASKNGWAEGIKHIAKQFCGALKNAGVEEIETTDKKFDHNTMEAVEKEKTHKKELDGVVAKEIKPGYMLGGKAIIPARVAVYEFTD